MVHSLGAQSGFEPAEANQEELEIAKELTHRILTEQKKGGYYPLTQDEATPAMIEGLSEVVQKDSYKQIKGLFGDYKEVEYKEMLENTEGDKYKIYRFKGHFETDTNIEVRTIMDAQGKIAGFYIKPWSDKI